MKRLYAIVLVACGVAAGFVQRTPAARSVAVEWPSTWDGRALRPLAPSDVEQRFASRLDRKSVV